MSIPPIESAAGLPSGEKGIPKPIYKDEDLKELYHVWMQWCNHPTLKSGEKLLDLLQNPNVETHFKELASHRDNPFPMGDFDKFYSEAKGFLSSWIDGGCDPKQTAPTSEFINDIYSWLNQKPTKLSK